MRLSILKSTVLRRGGFLCCRLWRIPYHVARSTLASREAFHLKSTLKVGADLGIKSASRASLKPTEGSPIRSLMVTSSAPNITKYQHIIDKLSNIVSRVGVYAGAQMSPVILILTTPTFATWLENVQFMSKVLKAIFVTRSCSSSKYSLGVTVLAAVVDGLPEKQENIGKSTQIMEGFAFLHYDQKLTAPQLWVHDNINGVSDQSHNQRACIIFRMSSSLGSEGIIEVGVPLANTIFQTGRISTLIASKWHKAVSSDQFKKIQQVEKTSVTIHHPSNPIIPLYLEIPLLPLTPPRRVVSSLGNILRQVTDAGGDVVHASKELEASVDSYLEARSLHKQAVTVWALIIPDSAIVDGNCLDVLATDWEKIQASWTDPLEPRMSRYVGCWLQGRGATLHRVLSGGGGWGLKQGLLSLDPDTTFRSSAGYDFDQSASIGNEQIQALSNIAKPGSWVQFMISHHLTPMKPIDTVESSTAALRFESINSLSFGCIPSTIDDIPQSSLDSHIQSDAKGSQPSINGFEGHFGALSEAGISIRVTENGAVTRSKIDVPYCNLQCVLVSPEKVIGAE